jgi:hypothetical protein
VQGAFFKVHLGGAETKTFSHVVHALLRTTQHRTCTAKDNCNWRVFQNVIWVVRFALECNVHLEQNSFPPDM